MEQRGPAGCLATRVLGGTPIRLPAFGRADTVDRGRAGNAGGASRVEHHRRRSAITDLLDGATQQAPVACDRLVRLAEVLAGAVGDRTHRLARPLVVYVDVDAHAGEGRVRLLVRVEAVVVVLVLAWHVVGQLIELEPLAAHLGLVDRRAEAGEDRVPVLPRVVDRNVPFRARHLD